MNFQSLLARIVVGGFLILTGSAVAYAQAPRTWVSGVGDDAFPCSRTFPCKTFTGAIVKTAAGGYINVLDPGSFGNVTITKSITIDGGPFMSAVTASLGVTGITINNAEAKVVLRNLEIDGLGTGNHGINVINVGSLHVQNVNIMHFAGNGINFVAGGAGGALYVDHVTVRGVAQAVYIVNGRASLTQLQAEANSKGVLVGANGVVSIRDSVATGNGEGFAATSASAILNIENSVAENNTWGISASGGSTFRISNCGIFSNTSHGLFNDGSSFIVSLSGNSVQGNPTAGVFTSTILKQ